MLFYSRAVYKLADFGTALRLEETDQYMSICGTEEYLVIAYCYNLRNKRASIREKICLLGQRVVGGFCGSKISVQLVHSI